jgi:hypothetical protein
VAEAQWHRETRERDRLRALLDEYETPTNLDEYKASHD